MCSAHHIWELKQKSGCKIDKFGVFSMCRTPIEQGFVTFGRGPLWIWGFSAILNPTHFPEYLPNESDFFFFQARPP